MDLQLPPFRTSDYLELHHALYTAPGLDRLVRKYQPEMIAVVRQHDIFGDLVRSQPQYVPVFFDDLLVLYLNRAAYPAVADAFELRYVDPFHPERIQASNIPAAITELERMLTQTDDTPAVQLALVAYFLQLGDVASASDYLDALKQLYPDNESVLYFGAQIDEATGQYEAALSQYRTLVLISDRPAFIQQKIADCHFRLQDYQRAYDAYREGLNPYADVNPDPQQTYQYAFSAFIVGDTARAADLLATVELLGDVNDEMFVSGVRQLRAALQGEQGEE